MHYDRGSDEEGVPQLTIGASFGATRELTLMHVKSGVTMSHGCRTNRHTHTHITLNKHTQKGCVGIGFV